MKHLFPTPEFPTTYRAVGIVKGEYLPGQDNLKFGSLLTPDGISYPAMFIGKELKITSGKFSGIQNWVVWPKMQKGSSKLRFHIIRPHKTIYNKLPETLATELSDYFSIRGVVDWQGDGQLRICIKRNGIPPEGEEKSLYWQPFFIEVDGYLPVKAEGQFWDLELYREGERLVIEDAELIQDRSNELEKDSIIKTAARPEAELSLLPTFI